MFQDGRKQTFLFKCEECQMIISADLEDEQDVKDAQENKLVLACICGGRSKVLRN